jgi:hypothetical protein
MLALASGDARFAAQVAAGQSAPEALRTRARLKHDGLIAVLPLLQARAGRAWCAVSDPVGVARLRADPRLVMTGTVGDPAVLQAYVRVQDLPALVDDYELHPALPATPAAWRVHLRPVADPWPFPDSRSAAPELVQALDLLDVVDKGVALDRAQVDAAWERIEQFAARDVPSWHRASQPPRAGAQVTGLRLDAAPRPARALMAASRVAGADTLSALLFVVGTPLQRAELLIATGWTPLRTAGRNGCAHVRAAARHAGPA